MKALLEHGRRRRNPAAAAGPAEQVAAGSVGAKLVGNQALVFLAGSKQDRAGTVAEERKALLIAGIDHPAVAVAADDERTLAVAGRHELRGDHQGEDEPGTGRLDVERGAGHLQPILDQVARRRKSHVGSECGHDEQVDVGRFAAGGFQAASRRVNAKIARCLVRQREPALVDARAIDDPIGVEPVRLAQVMVADDQLGQIASRAEDAHAQKCAGRRREMDLAVIHEQTDYNESYFRTLYQSRRES